MPKKILLIHEEPEVIKYCMDFLKRKDCEAWATIDPLRALEIFKKERPQICLFDWCYHLSPMQGLELLENIRNIDKEAFCVMLTMYADEETLKKARRLGVNEFLDPSDSHDKLDQVLAKISSLS